jgi:hypothetical protein
MLYACKVFRVRNPNDIIRFKPISSASNEDIDEYVCVGVLKSVIVQNAVFLVVMPCSLVRGHRCFRKIYCSHFQG